jgi:hypothetical protein
VNIPFIVESSGPSSEEGIIFKCLLTSLLYAEIPRIKEYLKKTDHSFPLISSEIPSDKNALIETTNTLLSFCNKIGYPLPPKIIYSFDEVTKNSPCRQHITFSYTPKDKLTLVLNRILQTALMGSTIGSIILTLAALSTASPWVIFPFMLVTWAMARTRSMAVVYGIASDLSQASKRVLLGAYAVPVANKFNKTLKSTCTLIIVTLNAAMQALFAWVSAGLFLSPWAGLVTHALMRVGAGFYALTTGIVVGAGSFEPVAETYGFMWMEEKDVYDHLEYGLSVSKKILTNSETIDLKKGMTLESNNTDELDLDSPRKQGLSGRPML